MDDESVPESDAFADSEVESDDPGAVGLNEPHRASPAIVFVWLSVAFRAVLFAPRLVYTARRSFL